MIRRNGCTIMPWPIRAAFSFIAAFATIAADQSGVATPDSWPMFRGSPGLTGTSPARLPNSPKLLWTYKTGGPVKSSPAIVNGKLYVGSDDKSLHCVDLKKGQKLWTFPTEAEIESSPLVLDGIVYFGSTDGGLYA